MKAFKKKKADMHSIKNHNIVFCTTFTYLGTRTECELPQRMKIQTFRTVVCSGVGTVRVQQGLANPLQCRLGKVSPSL